MIPPERLLAAPILVVDDQEPNVRLLQAMLAEAGYTRVISTTDSRQAAALYAAHHPDAVLLDLNMPHLSGFKVMEQLRALEPGGYLPVLVLTGDLDRTTRLAALSSGAKDFLTKPFDAAEALSRVRNLIEIRLLQRALREHNATLEGAVRERTRELRESQLEVVQRLAHAAERRDAATGEHLIRMSRYGARLGQALGLDGEDCELLLQASPLHDVGKIAIPDHILLKPGPLTPEESEIMRGHAAIGGEILANGTSTLVRTGRAIALTHHERWDGSGYPAGLAGEAIPLLGRICAVSDVFDALTSDRCYKRAWTVERAAAEIRAGAGRHFDPRVVTAFEGVVAELVEIRRAIGRDGVSASGGP
ncbi:MAG: HD domain-containing phosphohydrolase [bacterium]